MGATADSGRHVRAPRDIRPEGGPFTLDWLARHDNREAFLLVVLLAVFLAAWAMHQSGLSMALGAFIMGMLLSGSRYNMQIRAHIEPYKGLLMTLFFRGCGYVHRPRGTGGAAA